MNRPNQSSFHEMFDPNHSLSTNDLFEKLNQERSDGIFVEGVGKLAVQQTFYAEALHAFSDDIEAIPEIQGGNILKDSEIERAVDQDIDKVISVLRETISAAKLLDRDDEVVVAAKVLSAASSEGVFRSSGRAYYEHPREVAEIIKAAHNLFPVLDREDYNRLLVVAYCHDAFEDAFPKDGGSYLENDILVSPRLLSRLLESYGDSQHEAAASTLFLLSKPSGTNGKMDYEQYIKRGLHDQFFVINKLADIQHNRIIEPRVQQFLDDAGRKIIRKNSQYNDAKIDLLVAADKFDNLMVSFMAHAISQVSKQDLNEESSPEIFEIASNFRERVKSMRLENQKV